MLSFSLSYAEYFSRKWRRALIRRLELSAERRRDILFASHSDVIGSHIQACGAYEPEVLAAISLVVEKYNLGRGTALDIGANIGNHTLHMAGIFQEVIAFEPSPYISMVLRANVLRNRHDNVQVFECALGDYDGAGQLSELCTENLGMIEVSDYHTMATPQSVRSDSVKVCLGDQLLANIANAPNAITFIKIDVEGIETAALRGLYQTITTHRPMVAFESRCKEEGLKVAELLRHMGYEYFHALSATRFRPGALPSVRDLMCMRKRYMLDPIESLEDHHYPAVFAWTRPL